MTYQCIGGLTVFDVNALRASSRCILIVVSLIDIIAVEFKFHWKTIVEFLSSRRNMDFEALAPAVRVKSLVA